MQEFIMLTQEDKESYDQDGYVIKKSMFGKDEIDDLFAVAQSDNVIRSQTYGREDKDGNTMKLLWGIFSVHIKDEPKATSIAFAHEAFKYFESLKLDDDTTWREAKQALDNWFNEPANVGRKVRILLKCYHSNGERRFKAVYLKNL